jgi:uncharacterized Zn finger protein
MRTSHRLSGPIQCAQQETKTANRPCPNCGKSGRFLVDTSKIAHVDYYRCDFCGNVWVLDRSDPTKPPRFVTQPKDPNLD